MMNKTFGETYSRVMEAINVNVNEYIVLQDKANNASPIRHIRGPAKVYPTPSVPRQHKRRGKGKLRRAVNRSRTLISDLLFLLSLCSSYEEVVPDEQKQMVRKCVEINDATAIWLKQPDGLVLLVDQPQFYMPGVGEKVEKAVQKTLLKESEFCIMIMSETHKNTSTLLHALLLAHGSSCFAAVLCLCLPGRLVRTC